MENTRSAGLWAVVSVVLLILSLFVGTALGLLLFFASAVSFAIYAIRGKKFLFREERQAH